MAMQILNLWHKGVFWREWRMNRNTLVLLGFLLSIPFLPEFLLYFLKHGWEYSIREAFSLLENPDLTFLLMSIWVAGVGMYSFANEWVSYNLQFVIAGPVGRLQFIFTKFWNGWLYIQGIVGVQFLLLLLLGGTTYGISNLLYEWWAYAAGLSAVYAVAYLGSLLAGTFRGAVFITFFLLYGLEMYLHLLGFMLNLAFPFDSFVKTLQNVLFQAGDLLDVLQYTISEHLYANPFVRIGLWIFFFGIVYLVHVLFRVAPLERMGRFFLFVCTEKVAAVCFGIAVFVTSGAIVTRSVSEILHDRGYSPLSQSASFLLFLCSGAVITCAIWWLRNIRAKRRNRKLPFQTQR
jgi:ABC-type transport system involved in multi-copper enzyme maturation permease subunit